MNYSMKYSCSLILAVFLASCTTMNRAGFADGDADDVLEEVDIWVDVDEEPLEDPPAEVWVDPETDAHEDPVEEETPCGGPDDDCDGDGVTPSSGDCCDDDDRVYPGLDRWFVEPYYCPDESWDYDCNGTVDYEYDSTVTGPIDCTTYGASTCNSMSGWYGEVPECGETGRFVWCYYTSVSGCVYRTDDYEGLVRCR